MRFIGQRRQYTLAGLLREDLADDPLEQFQLWQEQAVKAELSDPTACVLATRQIDGTLRQRMVLMKVVDTRGLVFFTNFSSAKAIAISSDHQSSMLFPWNELDRQVSISGIVSSIADSESDAYFASRPRASQLAAWASKQSQTIASREALLIELEKVKSQFDGGEVPRPPNWGGYRLAPRYFEFWQGGRDRLHDRFCYASFEGGWEVSRLQP